MAWAAAIAVVPACNAISGVGDYEFPYAECFPDEVVPCYSGPPSTKDVGVCRGGERRCTEDGAQLLACQGEVTPGPIENCATAQDDDCDGKSGPKCSGAPLWVQAFGAEASEAQMGNDVAAVADGRVVLCGSYDIQFDFAPDVTVESPNNRVRSFVAGLTSSGVGAWAVGEESKGTQAQRVARGVAVNRDDGSAYVVGDDALELYAQKLSSAGAVLWTKQFGVGADGAVATHGSGVVLIGTSMGAIDFGGGPLDPSGDADAVVASLNAAGGHVWSRSFGGEGEQLGRSVATDGAGNVVVAGCFQNTINLGCNPALTDAGQRSFFVARLSPAGECLWSQAFPFQGTTVDCKPRVAADASGNVLFAASVQGDIDFGGEPLEAGGNRDVVVAKFALDGSHLWSHRFGDNNDQTVEDAAFDASGNVLLTGAFAGKVNFGDEKGLEKTANELMSRDGFVVKFDPAGKLVWSLQVASTWEAYGLGVAADPVGNVLVTGWFNGELTVGDKSVEGALGATKIFVAKLSP